MPSDNDWMRNYARYSTMVIQMVVIAVGGVLLGYKMDQWLHMKKPIFLVVFSFFFGFVALYLVFKDLIKKKD